MHCHANTTAATESNATAPATIAVAAAELVGTVVVHKLPTQTAIPDAKVVFVNKPRAVLATAPPLVAVLGPPPVCAQPAAAVMEVQRPASQYAITAGILTRLGEDIYQFALTAGALTAEAVLAHFNGDEGVTLHDIHTRFYTSRRFSSTSLDLGCTVVVFRDGQWTRGVVGKSTSSAVFITAAEGLMPNFWLCRRYELMYVECAAV
jgi:hypothetical protein